MHKRILARLAERRNKIREALPKTVAHLMPRSIVYWCIIRVWAESTSGKWSQDSPRKMRVETALDRWKETSQAPKL